MTSPASFSTAAICRFIILIAVLHQRESADPHKQTAGGAGQLQKRSGPNTHPPRKSAMGHWIQHGVTQQNNGNGKDSKMGHPPSARWDTPRPHTAVHLAYLGRELTVFKSRTKNRLSQLLRFWFPSATSHTHTKKSHVPHFADQRGVPLPGFRHFGNP